MAKSRTFMMAGRCGLRREDGFVLSDPSQQSRSHRRSKRLCKPGPAQGRVSATSCPYSRAGAGVRPAVRQQRSSPRRHLLRSQCTHCNRDALVGGSNEVSGDKAQLVRDSTRPLTPEQLAALEKTLKPFWKQTAKEDGTLSIRSTQLESCTESGTFYVTIIRPVIVYGSTQQTTWPC